MIKHLTVDYRLGNHNKSIEISLDSLQLFRISSLLGDLGKLKPSARKSCSEIPITSQELALEVFSSRNERRKSDERFRRAAAGNERCGVRA